jgi:hypothetical protein
MSKEKFKEKEKLVVCPRWVPDTKTDWPTDSRRKKNWLRVPDGRLTPRRTDQLIVDRNVTWTLTREWLPWQGPDAIVRVNTSPYSRHRGRRTSRNTQFSDRKQKSGHGLQMGARHHNRLADWPPVVNWLQSNWSQLLDRAPGVSCY